MQSLRIALLTFTVIANLHSLNCQEIEYFQLSDVNPSFTLGEGDTAEVIGASSTTIIPSNTASAWRYSVVTESNSYSFYATIDYRVQNSTIVGPCEVLYAANDIQSLINFKITRAEPTPTVTPTSAAASTLLSGWTWMQTYPLIFNESSDTWFYLMPVVIDGTATNWLYNYSTEEWTPLATE